MTTPTTDTATTTIKDDDRRELGVRGKGGLQSFSKIVFDLPDSVSEAFRQALHLRVVEMTTSSDDCKGPVVADAEERLRAIYDRPLP